LQGSQVHAVPASALFPLSVTTGGFSAKNPQRKVSQLLYDDVINATSICTKKEEINISKYSRTTFYLK